MEEKSKIKIIQPQEGFQQRFVRANADLVIGGSAMGVGKSFAALLMAAEPSLDPEFRMVCIRKTLNDVKVGGSLTDDASRIYDGMATLKISENPRLTFRSGAFMDFTHMENENANKLLERVKGWQYDCIFMDEGTGYEWNTFKTVFSRNRGKAKWTGKFRIVTNPKKSHWLRDFCDWWIDPISGFPIPERDGVIRYFYMKGEKVTEVAWGSTKKEVYDQCKPQIDPILTKLNSSGEKYTYESLIKSCSFLSGKLSDNKELLKNNPSYIGSVSAMGEKKALVNLMGSWNIDLDSDENAPIQQEDANRVFMNDPMVNNDRWITVDLADVGTDNLVALAWDGLHVINHMIISKSTPRQNAEKTQMFAAQHDVADRHIIFDATSARYFIDYIPDAMPYISGRASMGMYGREAQFLKDECYLRLVKLISLGMISVSPEVGQSRYVHQNLKQEISFQTEFTEECSVVRFKEIGSGKKRLANKREMNAMLGKGRSMDVLDGFAMRMLPLLAFPYGEELDRTRVLVEDKVDFTNWYKEQSIYDDSTWA